MSLSGSGKTTLGKVVAQKLGYPYFDVDDYIRNPFEMVKPVEEHFGLKTV